jgi:hypothetical protein
MKVGELVVLLLEQDQEKEVCVNLVFGKGAIKEITHAMDNGLGKVEILAPKVVKENEEREISGVGTGGDGDGEKGPDGERELPKPAVRVRRSQSGTS